MRDSRDYRSEILSSSEDRRREFKASAPWEQLKHKIARGAQAMANTRDGGLIIIGVQDNGSGCVATGIENEHLPSFEDDEIKSFINQFADPYVKCDINRPTIDQKNFVVIDISEFAELPVVCKKTLNDEHNRAILKIGGVYIRSYKKPESCLVESQTEMRELTEISVERGIRKFLAIAERTGISLGIQPTDTRRPLERFWRATAPQIDAGGPIDLTDLLAKPRDLAADAATEIVRRFAGSEMQSVNVRVVQRELFSD